MKIKMLALLSFAALLVAFFAPNSAYAIDFETMIRSQLAVEALKADTGLSQHSTARVQRQIITVEGASDLVELTLSQSQLGPVKMLLKGPHGFLNRGPEASLKTIFLASGFFTGKAAVRLMPDEPDLIVVGFEYSYNMTDFQKDPKNIFEFVRKTPAQIAMSLQWISEQPWLQFDGLVVMGVSLGGLFLPSSLHIVESLGTDVHGTILAFTGAHLPPVLYQLLEGQVPHDKLDIGIQLVNNLTSLHDPKLHVPFLQGRFLTIRADQDQIFPRESSQLLEDLLPDPKTHILVHGPHIDVDQPAVIEQTKAVVQNWLTTGL